ncbi:very long chain fatty acid elongase 5-like [Brachionichthys hirsutus]|uniref:very long chain fatty acid elongase 5 n=1 Tax=Brachionichthys hirsutus TaxID=412623 RepID=UPI0036050E54
METINHNLNTYFDSFGPRDKRVQGWLLLDNYPPTFALTIVYLLLVWMGPKYMKHRQPCSCRRVMGVYNLGLTLLSFYMFFELITTARNGGYDMYCQNTHSSPEADTKIMNVLWWYYFSKVIELMDTVFFVLRKNNHQITFLHVFHHASMLNIWWFAMNWIPCGHSYLGASLNSFIHVLMYSYYGLSVVPAVRPYLWWKKYITQLQLTQFFVTASQTMLAIIWPCGFPMGWLYFQISYMIVLSILFTNFYIQTYTKKSNSLKNGSPASANGHANVMPPTERPAPKKLRVD